MDEVLDVKLPVFEGPLDLLLHLIEKNKIDIYDIPIAEVTGQYLEDVRELEEEDPSLASRFLVMAATLLAIKSEMLLPGSEPEEDDEDPRRALIEQLTTYKIYKEAAAKLSLSEIPEMDYLCRGSALPDEVGDYREPVDVDAVLDTLTLKRLSEIFEEVMKRKEESIDPVRSRYGKIRREKISLADRINQVRDYFTDKTEVSFKELINETGGGRIGMIMTFLSILELAKSGFLYLTADKRSADIRMSRRDQ